MGSPGGGDREKDLSKRRKCESSHYVKARDWDDDEAYDEDRRHRSSKSKKSSKRLESYASNLVDYHLVRMEYSLLSSCTHQ